MFVQTLNLLTGHAEWVVAGAEGASSDDVVSAGLVGTTLYLDMLTDTARNRAYRLAISKTVHPGNMVLDIGTGTGLLAMLAAEASYSGSIPADDALDQGAGSSARVTACELFPPMARLAQRVITHNRKQHQIRVVAKRSDELAVGSKGPHAQAAADMPMPADVVVTEIFDSELLGEGVLPTMRHAAKHLLAPSGRVIPASATLLGQLVQSEVLWRCADLHGVEQLSGIAPSLTGDSAADNAGSPQWAGAHAWHLDPLYPHHLRLLSQPFELLHFDFANLPPQDQETELTVKATGGGAVHAIVFWWRLNLDTEGSITLSTAPCWAPPPPSPDAGLLDAASANLPQLPQQWRDHWKQCWIPVKPAFDVHAGANITVGVRHDDVSLSACVRPALAASPASAPLHAQDGTCSPSKRVRPTVEAMSGPFRLWALGQTATRRSYKAAVQAAVARASEGCVEGGIRVITLGDGPLLALEAASCPGVHVIAVQDLAVGEQCVAAAAASLPHKSAAVTVAGLSSLLADAERRQSHAQASARAPVDHSQAADVVLAEPYFTVAEGLLPWAHLRFWHERDELLACGAVRPDHVMVPCRGRLRAVAAALPDLWRTRQPVHNVEGMDLSPANALLTGQPDREHARSGSGLGQTLLPCRVWQCGGYAELSERFTLLEFDFTQPVSSTQGSVKLRISPSGQWQAVVLWMEHQLSPDSDFLSTNAPHPDGAPSSGGQAVLLVQPPHTALPATAEQTVLAAFDGATGDICAEVLAR